MTTIVTARLATMAWVILLLDPRVRACPGGGGHRHFRSAHRA